MKKINRIFISPDSTIYNKITCKSDVCILRFLFFVFFSIVFLSKSGTVFSQTTKTWVPTNGGDWTVAANWSPSGAPSAGDDVIINSNQSSPINNHPNIELRSLTINGNCTFTSDAGWFSGRTITIRNIFSIGSGATFTLGYRDITFIITLPGAYSNISLNSEAEGSISGNLNTLTTNTITNNGILTIAAGSLITGSGTFSLNSGGTLQVANTAGITTTAAGATGAIQTSTRNYNTGANYVYNGSSSQVTGNGLTQNTPANLTINNASGVSLSANTTITGRLTMTSGQLNLMTYTLTAGSLTGSGNITGTTTNKTITVGGDNTSPAAYSGVISNGAATVSLTKTGSGILTLSGANTYTGTTTISGGVLQLGSADRIANGSNIVMNGGTLSTGSSTGYSETVGTLNLQAASTIALGTGSHTLAFSASNGVAWGTGELIITGWSGSWDGTSGTAGKIFVGSSAAGLTASQLAQIVFSGPTGAPYTSTILSSGELVPLSIKSFEVVFNTSDNWIVPCGVTSITVHAWGGGGGGGGANNGRGGGGGGGAYSTSNIPVTAGDDIIITVGTGGLGVNNSNGQPGGLTTIERLLETLLTANGGLGGNLGNGGNGAGGNGGSGTYNGGNGGSASGTDGGGGGGGAASGSSGTSGSSTSAGLGGIIGTYLGGNGGANQATNNSNGNNGFFRSGGGGGAKDGNGGATRKGGDGAAGQVIIVYSGSGSRPTISPGTISSVCQGDPSVDMTYTSEGCPNQYSIDWDAVAQGQGFTDVALTNLLESPLAITVPSGAVPGTYKGTISVKNTTTNLTSGPVQIQVTVDPNRWTGATADWHTASNWCSGVVPVAASSVIIPSGVTPPVISSGILALCTSLTISPGASLTISEGNALTVSGDLTNLGTLTINSLEAPSGSLIVQGTTTGNVVYNRKLRPEGTSGSRHFISSPIANQAIFTDPAKVARIRVYDETTNTWPAVSSGNFQSGKGYILTQASGYTGEYTFTGSVVNSVSITATSPYATGYITRSTAADYNPVDPANWAPDRSWTNYGGGGFNLLGNPFTSAMSASTFRTVNSGKFDPYYQALYIYDGPNNRYLYAAAAVPGDPVSGSFGANIQAGQGFMVLALYNNIVFDFTSSMRTHSTATILAKSGKYSESEKAEDPWPHLIFKVKLGDFENMTTMVFHDTMSLNLDPGYDVGQFSLGPEIEIYTRLADGDNGTNLVRQALPSFGFDQVVVPVGIDTENGGEVTFSADIIPLTGYKFYLEDRQAGIFTDLSEGNYTVTINPATYGTGQFFIHTSSSILTGIKPEIKIPEADNLRLWVSDKTLIIKGNVGARASCEVYDMNGRKMLTKTLGEGEMNSVAMPSSAKGVFIVRIKDGFKTSTLKAVMH